MIQDGRQGVSNISARNSKVIVQTTTWERDSHDLFDYEASHVTRINLNIEESSKIYRSLTEEKEAAVKQVPENQMVPKDGELLIKILMTKEGKCHVAPPEKTSSSAARKLWLVVKDLKTPGHVLSEGDTIKLGRFRLRVKQICKANPGPNPPELRLFDDAEMPTNLNLKDRNISENELNTLPCRICLLDGQGEDKDDPLIDPCSCNGSIKWVHLNCLKHWIDGRRKTDQQGQTPGSLFFKQLQCELCKQTYPPSVTTREGRKLTLVSMPKTSPPFIVLENVTNVNRGFHILSMSEKRTLKVGRGHECDVRISDVSISRTHAIITYNDGNQNFVLDDHDSKFGTLICIRKQQALDSWSGSLSLQVGRTTLKVAYEDQLHAEQSTVDGSSQLSGGDSGANGDQHPAANYGNSTGFPRIAHPPSGGGGTMGSRTHNYAGTPGGNCRIFNMWPTPLECPTTAWPQPAIMSGQNYYNNPSSLSIADSILVQCYPPLTNTEGRTVYQPVRNSSTQERQNKAEVRGGAARIRGGWPHHAGGGGGGNGINGGNGNGNYISTLQTAGVRSSYQNIIHYM